MFGQQRYKLPGSKKREAPVEPEEPIDVGRPVGDEDGDFDSSYLPETNFQDDDYYEDDGYEYDATEGDNDYFFEEQQEPKKVEPAPIVQFESNRPDIPSLDTLSTTIVKEEVIEKIEKEEGVKREYHARDESLPFDSPPGYVWAFEKGTKVPFFGSEHFLNALGFGDASKRYRWRAEDEEPAPPPDILPTGSAAEQYMQKLRNQHTRELLARQINQQDDDDEEEMEIQEFFLKDLETLEPDDAPAGIWFWNGPRWEHWFHGYESPSSFTGYPTQWFYRTVHLFFPDLYDSFKYERHYGELSFRGTTQFAWWFITHPCIPTIFLNFALFAPFVYWRQIRIRTKIIKNRMAMGRSLFRTVEEHIPIMLRRIRYRAIRKRRRRWFRWIAFYTFAFAPNCWDLIGHSIVNPTEEWWDKNYINKYTDGIKTQSGDLQKWLDKKPVDKVGLVTKPNIDAYDKFKSDAEIAKDIREERRRQIFGTQAERADGWKVLAAEEQKQRYSALQRKAGVEEVASRATSNDL